MGQFDETQLVGAHAVQQHQAWRGALPLLGRTQAVRQS